MEIPYHYWDEWNIEPVSVTAKCTSVEITGNWTGTNNYGYIIELNITEMDEAGDVIGEKPSKYFEPDNITVRLNVDDASITGYTYLNFTVMQ